jgi:peptide/nickel transport system substrate-binding protein
LPAFSRHVFGHVCLALVLLVLVAGCRTPSLLTQKPRATRGGSITEALVGTPGTLNPLFAQEDNARDIDHLIYQGLTTVGANQEPEPLLARSWVLSADRTTYTFSLRGGVRWADGVPFTVADVLFTFAVLQHPAYDQPLAGFWRGVKVDSPAPDQVRFTLKAPSSSFPDALQIGIIPRHLFSTTSPDSVAADPHSGVQALGTGPFKVQSISSDRRIVTLARNGYAQPSAHLEKFVFRSFPTLSDAAQAFSTGIVDAVGGIQPAQLGDVNHRSDVHLLRASTFTLAAVLLNVSTATSATLDPLVRHALVEAVNRQRIVAGVLNGEADVAPGPIPPSSWAYASASAKYRYNPADAARLLSLDGWTLPPGQKYRSRAGTTLSVTLDAVDSYPYRDVAAVVADQLRAIGVQVQLETVPAAVLVERYLMGRHYQMLLAAFDIGSDPDEYTLWHSDSHNPTLSFDKLPGQALIDKDLEDGRTAGARTLRASIYSDFQALMADAAPAIFLYEPHYLYALSSRIQGAHMNAAIEPADRFQYVTDWFLPGQPVQ